jgi:hypothetical protein
VEEGKSNFDECFLWMKLRDNLLWMLDVPVVVDNVNVTRPEIWVIYVGLSGSNVDWNEMFWMGDLMV